MSGEAKKKKRRANSLICLSVDLRAAAALCACRAITSHSTTNKCLARATSVVVVHLAVRVVGFFLLAQRIRDLGGYVIGKQTPVACGVVALRVAMLTIWRSVSTACLACRGRLAIRSRNKRERKRWMKMKKSSYH